MPTVPDELDRHAQDVLRYWLASVRLEESLKVRPRARPGSELRAQGSAVAPRVDQPSAGQEYFKLPRLELEAAIEPSSVTRAFDAELSAFFEGWLLQHYRRGTEDGELAHVLAFPVVHLPRGELAGLLRRGTRLRFQRSDGANFRPPTRIERQRGQVPLPPEQVTIDPTPRDEDAWPYFVDTRLLNQTLGVSTDHIDALFDALRERERLSEQEMIALVATTLEAAARELGAPIAEANGSPFARLLHAMQTLLKRSPKRAEVYPVGIIIDGTQAKTTWHLQRELALLLANDAPSTKPLAAYLTGRALFEGRAPQRALYRGTSLTASQRAAAEQFWGSRFSAVQGPPGTGKTTLILHVCAEALVHQVDALLDRQTMGSALLLVTSGNNRAVDNVMEPLSAAHALPLALRVGSRQVCEHQLGPQLRSVASWLAHAEVEPEPVRQRAYARALADYADVRAQIAKDLAPQQRALAEGEERARITLELAGLPKAKNAGTVSLESARSLDAPVRKLVQRIEALSALCSAKPTMAHVNAVARHYEKTAARELHALETALSGTGFSLEVPLPPLQTPLDVPSLMEAWEEGAEMFLLSLSRLRDDVAAALDGERETTTRRALERRLEALGPERPIPLAVQDEARSLALFERALQVREAWAKVHARPLRGAVEEAARLVEQERSLRPIFRDAPREAKLLCQLFGVWGSTLLSIGNCLPATEDFTTRVIVDEAGQCHPAHVVSALMRAEQAMILGDVHQLPPVLDLTRDDDERLVRGLRPKLDLQKLAPYRVHTDSKVSAQALADRAVGTRHTLVDHFRCQPEIIAVSDALCGYGLRVHAPMPDSASHASALPHALCLRDVRGGQARYAGSLCNELELQHTMQLLMLLLARGVSVADVAIITPYRGQLDRLRQALVQQRIPLERSAEVDQLELSSMRADGALAIGTVHRFQGGERSIVLFSSVVTDARSLGFLNERPNLLNVAISRAQQHFVCLGDGDTLRRGPRTRLLVDAAHAF